MCMHCYATSSYGVSGKMKGIPEIASCSSNILFGGDVGIMVTGKNDACGILPLGIISYRKEWLLPI